MASEAVIVSSPPQTVRLELRPFVLPPDLLPNRANRLHGRTTSRLRRQLRGDAGLALVSAMRALPPGAWSALYTASLEGPVWCRVTVAYEREITQGKTGRRRYRKHADPDGLLSACKALIDAFADVYLISDDKRLRHAPPVQVNDPEGIGFVVIELWHEEGREDDSQDQRLARPVRGTVL